MIGSIGPRIRLHILIRILKFQNSDSVPIFIIFINKACTAKQAATNGVISTPRIISKLDEDATIEVGNKIESISIKMKAAKTVFNY